MNTLKRVPIWVSLLVCSLILVVAVLAIGMDDSAQAQGDGEDEFTPISDYPEIIAAVEGGTHGTWDEGRGPNTYCSRCHSPQNWDPESRPGPPPNCITCKFPTDEEMRFAETMDFVPEEEWVGIGCETCHVVEGDMINATGNAWYNPVSGEYVAVATTNELCAKCHVDSTGVSETGGRGVDHKIILGGSAHANWAATTGAHRPSYCTDCHSPHSQEPLGCADCHAYVTELDTHIQGLNAIHLDKVECIACHDASGADVGPDPDEEMGGVWTTIQRSVDRSGEPTVTAIVSHSVQWTVECERCHFEGNEAGLPVMAEE